MMGSSLINNSEFLNPSISLEIAHQHERTEKETPNIAGWNRQVSWQFSKFKAVVTPRAEVKGLYRETTNVTCPYCGRSIKLDSKQNSFAYFDPSSIKAGKKIPQGVYRLYIKDIIWLDILLSLFSFISLYVLVAVALIHTSYVLFVHSRKNNYGVAFITKKPDCPLFHVNGITLSNFITEITLSEDHTHKDVTSSEFHREGKSLVHAYKPKSHLLIPVKGQSKPISGSSYSPGYHLLRYELRASVSYPEKAILRLW